MDMQHRSIKEIKAWVEQINYSLSDAEYHQLSLDQRAGIRPIIERIGRMREQEQRQKELWEQMTTYERELRLAGYKKIAGIDEVGRGPLAGPVVCAAVILPEDFFLPGLNDSKQLSKDYRESYYKIIQDKAVTIGISIVSAQIIDEINILNATKSAMKEAILNLSITPDYLLIDALTLDLEFPQLGIIGGDGKSISIAAASIVAKVTRDRFMSQLAEQYPEYGFERHMGYGTREHLEAIARHGVSPIHRQTFAGVKEWVESREVEKV